MASVSEHSPCWCRVRFFPSPKSSFQVTPDSLIYRTTLFYKPTRSGNPLIVRATPAEVPIECHYPR